MNAQKKLQLGDAVSGGNQTFNPDETMRFHGSVLDSLRDDISKALARRNNVNVGNSENDDKVVPVAPAVAAGFFGEDLLTEDDFRLPVSLDLKKGDLVDMQKLYGEKISVNELGDATSWILDKMCDVKAPKYPYVVLPRDMFEFMAKEGGINYDLFKKFMPEKSHIHPMEVLRAFVGVQPNQIIFKGDVGLIIFDPNLVGGFLKPKMSVDLNNRGARPLFRGDLMVDMEAGMVLGGAVAVDIKTGEVLQVFKSSAVKMQSGVNNLNAGGLDFQTIIDEVSSEVSGIFAMNVGNNADVSTTDDSGELVIVDSFERGKTTVPSSVEEELSSIVLSAELNFDDLANRATDLPLLNEDVLEPLNAESDDRGTLDASILEPFDGKVSRRGLVLNRMQGVFGMKNSKKTI